MATRLLLAIATLQPVAALRKTRAVNKLNTRAHASEGTGTAVVSLDRSARGKNDISDYDCDGDGVEDCGSWNYGGVHCNNYPKCGYKIIVGDLLIDHSCRCMTCYEVPGTAAAEVPMDTTINSMYYGRWQPWNKLARTCASWLMPTSDADLQAILLYAKRNQYIVRPSGATHSTGGIVTDWGDDSRNVLAVSLAEYVAPGNWEYKFKEQSTGTATAMVNAGWTQLQLYEKIRPLNYFLPTQSAGPMFQLGGMIANCVHGGNYQRGFLHQYVVRMRVMLHDGTIRVIDDPAELRFWRNSFGLLGFITALEFSLDYRPQFQAYFKQQEVNWNEEDFWTFLKQDGHADLPQDVPGQAGDGKAFFGQFFLNAYEAGDNGKATMTAIIWRANENATEEGILSTAPDNVADGYRDTMTASTRDEILSDWPENGKGSFDVYNEYNSGVRHWGGPNILPLGWDLNDILGGFPRTMTKLSMSGSEMLINSNRDAMNDGFYAMKVPNVIYAAFFIEPSKLFEAFNVVVDSFKRHDGSSAFAWNGPPELRFIKVEDDAVMNPVPAGLWAVSEILYFPVAEDDQDWKRAFKHLQDEWEDRLGARPHIGKMWGFDTAADGTVQPYQWERACRLYSDSQKSAFDAFRRQTDPDDLFAGGDAMKLLSSCA